jgi:hypothetical protein
MGLVSRETFRKYGCNLPTGKDSKVFPSKYATLKKEP